MAHVGNKDGPGVEDILEVMRHAGVDFDCGEDAFCIDVEEEKLQTERDIVIPPTIDEDGRAFLSFGPVHGVLVPFYFDGGTPVQTLRGTIHAIRERREIMCAETSPGSCYWRVP